MPAPTLAALYKFEEQLETGFNAILQGTTGNVYFRRSTDVKATPWIDVLVVAGAALGHIYNDPDAGQDEDMFAASLECTICTSRSKNNSDHHTMLAAVRTALMPSSGDYNVTNFPYLTVMEIVPGPSSYEVDQDTGCDMTTLQYDFFFAIRPTAWPAS